MAGFIRVFELFMITLATSPEPPLRGQSFDQFLACHEGNSTHDYTIVIQQIRRIGTSKGTRTLRGTFNVGISLRPIYSN